MGFCKLDGGGFSGPERPGQRRKNHLHWPKRVEDSAPTAATLSTVYDFATRFLYQCQNTDRPPSTVTLPSVALSMSSTLDDNPYGIA